MSEGLRMPVEAAEQARLPQEFFDFQYEVVKRLAQISGRPILDLADEYTNILSWYSRDLSTQSRLPGVDENNLSAKAHENYLHLIDSIRSVKPRFGCFRYEEEPSTNTVSVHFMNTERGTFGPLSAERISQRHAELTEMFREIRTKGNVSTVQGRSWLYNIEAYRRLFPESYTANPEVDADPSLWKTGAIWGQFYDSDYRVRAEQKQHFLSELERVADILDALPYKPLKVSGPVEDFYKLYGIE